MAERSAELTATAAFTEGMATAATVGTALLLATAVGTAIALRRVPKRAVEAPAPEAAEPSEAAVPPTAVLEPG